MNKPPILVAISTSKPIDVNELDIAFERFKKRCRRKNIILRKKLKKLYYE